ncbi:hypothetical protein [Cellulomonas sp.]
MATEGAMYVQVAASGHELIVTRTAVATVGVYGGVTGTARVPPLAGTVELPVDIAQVLGSNTVTLIDAPPHAEGTPATWTEVDVPDVDGVIARTVSPHLARAVENGR